jgi:hypothetical protein
VPILGHLPEMRKHGPMNMFARCSKIYGPVFKARLLRPLLTCAAARDDLMLNIPRCSLGHVDSSS